MSEELLVPQMTPPQIHDPMAIHDEEAPCRPSLWRVVAIQSQNALNDKIAQYVLLGLAQVIPALTNSQREAYAHVGALLLALPLILFMPLAGWLADRFSKRSILLWCSIAQWAGMAAIAVSFYFDWFWAATFCFFILATQATIFSPAKGGIIKELVGEKQLSWANSWVQATGLVAIVAGPWLGGALFKWTAPHFKGEPHMAAFWPAFLLALAALIPVLLAYRVRRTPSHSQEPARWGLLWEHFFHLKDLLRERTLRLTACGVSFFWFAATLIALLLVQVAQVMTDDRSAQAELSGFLLVWVGLGIAAGSVIVGLVSTNRIELGLIPLGGLGMAMGCVAVALPWIDLGGWVFNVLMFWIGVSSAVFLVPLNAYLQDLVEPAKRGRQLAASGLMDALGMFFGIIVQYVLLTVVGLSGAAGVRLQFVIFGVLCLLTAIYVVRIIPQNFLRFVCLALIKLIYRVRVEHSDRIPKAGGALLIANHVSYIDAFIVSAACERKVRFIASDQFHKMRFIGPFLTLFDVVPVSPTRAKDAIVSVAEAVAAGDLVCIFPEGQITRTGVLNEIRKGFELIARRGQVPVVPVFLDDLWGSVLSFERGRFFKKWPKRYAYQVSVSFGNAEPPESSTAEWARTQFRDLSAEAMNSRGELRTRLEIATVLELCRQPWRTVALGANNVTRAMLLAEAWTLARRWADRINADRVLVLSQGYHGLVANLALRLGGFTPVNVSPALVDTAAEWLGKLPGLGIGAVIDGEPQESSSALEWINLSAEMAGMDSLRLAMRIASIYVFPKRFQAWLQSKKRHQGAVMHEAVGWLETSPEGELGYRSLSQMDVLMQSEQLSSMDAVREGESVWVDGGFASIEGTVMGLWHTLLQGGIIITERERLAEGEIFIGGASLASDIAAHQPPVLDPDLPVPGARALYCFDGTSHLIPPAAAHSLEHPWKLTVCPSFIDVASGRILTLSLPDAPAPSRTAEAQLGSKNGSVGRILPGYKVEKLANGLCCTSPDGVTIPLPTAKIDSEDYVNLGNSEG
jgi:acyl-[acyl-carrier-protein]-phospholipid O-acyltransferase/long-chain-fatty-acid--[acyl-carrier-protein] ligase